MMEAWHRNDCRPNLNHRPPFSFSRQGGGSEQRAKWKTWIQSSRSGLPALEIAKEIKDAQLSFAAILPADCGVMVSTLAQLHDAQTPSEEELWSSSILELIIYLSQKRHLVFTSNDLDYTLRYVIRALEKSLNNSDSCLEALQALSFLVFENGGRTSKVQDSMIKIFMEKILKSQIDIRCRSSCYGCLGNLLQRRAFDEHYADALLASCIRDIEIQNSSSEEDQVKESKLISSVLRVLHGTALAFGATCFQKKDILILVSKLRPLITFGMTLFDRDAMKVKRQRNIGSKASDSEMSESELKSCTSSNLKKQSEKVRIGALEVLESLCIIDFKSMQSQWATLLPQRNGCNPSTSKPTLLTVMLFDSQPKVRGSAFSAMKVLVEHYPIRLLLSQPPTKRRAFDSVSEQIGRSIAQIHLVLSKVLIVEQNPTALKQSLGTCAALLKVVPYELYDNGKMILEIISSDSILDKVFANKSPSIALAAEDCLTSILRSKASLINVIGTWVEEKVLLRVLESPNIDARLFLRVSAALVKSYSSILFPHWDKVRLVVFKSFANSDPSYREAALSMVEDMAQADRKDPSVGVCELEQWSEIIAVHLPRALRDIDSGVRTRAAAVVAELRSELWQDVSLQHREECVQVIVEATAGNPQVQLTCLTALSSIALSFKESYFIGMVTPTVLASLKSDDLSIRTKAAVVLANMLSDHFLDQQSDLEVATRLLLAHACIDRCSDHDKVACPILRALGYLVAFSVATKLEPCMETQIKEILQSFASNVDYAAKLRWSACNSVAYILSNHNRCSIPWNDSTLLHSVLETVVGCNNFKVRVAAVSCLLSTEVFPLGMRGVIFTAASRAYCELYAVDKLTVAQLPYKDPLGTSLARVLINILAMDTMHEPCELVMHLLHSEHVHLMVMPPSPP